MTRTEDSNHEDTKAQRKNEKFVLSSRVHVLPSFVSSCLRGSVSLAVAGVLAATILTLAYQARPTQSFAVGDAARDAAIVRGFYPPQRQTPDEGGVRYRWTRGGDAELLFPGVGRGPARVALTLNRAGNPAETVRVLANGGEIAALRLLPGFATYALDIPAPYMTSGNLILTLQAAPYAPPGDRRVLGVVVSEVAVTPTGAGLALPPARVALLLWLGAMGAATGLLVAGYGPRVVVAGAGATALALAAGLVADRAFVAAGAGGIAAGGAAMLAVAASVRLTLPPLCRWRGLAVSARDVAPLAVIAGAVVALRLAGSLHPAIAVVDRGFHLNRLADVVDNRLLLLRIQSAEVGGRDVLYPPTPYLLLWPFTALVRDRALLLVLFALVGDAVRLCVLWVVARVVTGGVRAAHLTAATMAAMPVGWIVYSWGIFANLFGEVMLTLLFALLALSYRRLAGPRRVLWGLAFACVLALALLAHLGVFVLTAAAVGLVVVVRLLEVVGGRRLAVGSGAKGALAARGSRLAACVAFAVAAALAVVVAFGLFYRFPAARLLEGSFAQPVEAAARAEQEAPQADPRIYRTGGATPDERIGLVVVRTANPAEALVRELWGVSYAFYGVWPVVAALVGLVLLVRRARTESRMDATYATSTSYAGDAAVAIGVWLGAAAIMLVVGLVGRLFVRYPLFALPAVSLGAGVALAALWGRGTWGRVATVALLLVAVVWSLLVWYDRIVYAFKPVV